ncbi:MAG: cobalamin B12-binding domain-containing protein [Anaerolineaceae bacterium]
MKTVVAGALGECVHVAGVYNFLRLAEKAGWRTVFLGPAISPADFLEAVRREKADLAGVSYRLTPETGERLLGEFAELADDLRSAGVRFVFGGTPPVAEKAHQITGFFERVFDGSEGVEEIAAFLRDEEFSPDDPSAYPRTLIDRIQWKAPYPLLRHHFGLPTMEETLDGIRQIAEARVLDVISLGIDQDAQENFYHPERQDPRARGAGGVPVRSEEDYRALFDASRYGNYPLMRTYSGTDDFIRLAEMYMRSINNAWCAIPLFWFNQMDGRGPLTLESSIREHQLVMSWYGQRGIPVELNEPHHWGMRDAPDVIYVVSAYLSAWNAKEFGVKDYIAQMMFNSPNGTSDKLDLAKMLALLEMIQPLESENFRVWRQTRTGLLSYPLEQNAARAHLSATIYLQMALKPHIVHIVGHTEAHHAATGADVIDASRMARLVIERAIDGQPDLLLDPVLLARKDHLKAEATITLQAIRNIAEPGVDDPFSHPATLAKAVKAGVLDAPQLKNNRFAAGTIQTRVIKGGCEVVDNNGQPLSEAPRLVEYL